MQDKDIEENYHAQFMQQALRQAGFDSKILRGLDELRWDDAGQLIDGDDRLVNCVWKTWAWETAIEQVREVSETEYAAVPIRTGHTNQEVRLIDVLLRPEVLVFEPLWTVILVIKRFCRSCGNCSHTTAICLILISLLMKSWRKPVMQ